jgi:diacylglycerol kinase (ATP)
VHFGVRKLFIVINNTAAKARSAWPLVSSQLNAHAIDYELCETTFAGDATQRTRAALHAGHATVVVLGGDGTLSETAEGFFNLPANDSLTSLPTSINPNAALAILPAGTGNDFARGLLNRRASLADWLAILIGYCKQTEAATTSAVDVMAGRCEGEGRVFICLNAATMGIGGETGARVAAQGKFLKQFSGELRFMVAAVGAVSAWRERPVRIVVDGRTVIEGPMNLVAVANGLYAGGGMMLSPGALIDDGRLDVVTASGLNRLEIVRELPRIHRGGHVANPKVRIVQGEHVRVETFTADDRLLIEADGNVRGKSPVEFRIMPKAIRVVG